ncbi:hypothetical protein TNCV_3639481 [Trichonephila clavipes]|nr:hypothetical protein TNCV_3639481 [Trichonephila clavipes]
MNNILSTFRAGDPINPEFSFSIQEGTLYPRRKDLLFYQEMMIFFPIHIFDRYWYANSCLITVAPGSYFPLRHLLEGFERDDPVTSTLLLDECG